MCRSRRELSNAYLLAKIGVDTAENEPLEVWGENSIHYSLHSLGPVAPPPAFLLADRDEARLARRSKSHFWTNSRTQRTMTKKVTEFGEDEDLSADRQEENRARRTKSDFWLNFEI